MKRRPELGTQEQFFPVNPRVFDPLTDFLFVLVHEGSVDVTVAALDGSLDSLGDFTGTGCDCRRKHRDVSVCAFSRVIFKRKVLTLP